MADRPYSTFATGTTGQVLTITGPASGLQWIIYQLSVETLPLRVGATAVVRRNGRLLTSSTSGGRDSAQGPPAFLLSNSDTFTVTWDSVVSGDELICTLMYTETQWGMTPTGYGVV